MTRKGINHFGNMNLKNPKVCYLLEILDHINPKSLTSFRNTRSYKSKEFEIVKESWIMLMLRMNPIKNFIIIDQKRSEKNWNVRV